MHSNCYYELVFLLIDRVYFFSSAHGRACNLRVCNVQEKRVRVCFASVRVSKYMCVSCSSAHYRVKIVKVYC